MSGRGEALTVESEALHELHHMPSMQCPRRTGGHPDACDLWNRLVRIETAAAREALPSVEEMAQAMHDVIAPLDGHVHDDSCDPALTVDTSLATALLDHIRVARASDGGR